MGKTVELPPGTERIVIEEAPGRRKWLVRLLLLSLLVSVGANAFLYYDNRSYFGNTQLPTERFHSGDADATSRIALLRISGTISPPFTGRLLKQIRKAHEDDNVKGAILVVDSPGGFVADSHQIYHELKKLSADKPVYVSMKRLAASGGYYIAMGVGTRGRVFAEPTTWTGSIGVIIPRYNAAELVEKVGVSIEPLTTGEFKDSLNPFRDLTEADQALWGAILDDAYERFLGVIDENRSQLTGDALRELAKGQLFTAKQALANGLIDEIGFIEDVVDAMKEELDLQSVRVITYYSAPSLLEIATGFASAEQRDPLSTLMEASVPRALYLCSWTPLPPVHEPDGD